MKGNTNEKYREGSQPDEDDEDLKRPRERRRKPLCKHVSTELQWRQGNDDCNGDCRGDCHDDCHVERWMIYNGNNPAYVIKQSQIVQLLPNLENKWERSDSSEAKSEVTCRGH